ncbi:MAG: GNAT family N-acetyltransferase [Bacillota bacterium]|nr:GNAT family N-acetyltransferase [Bacillota bacterium]
MKPCLRELNINEINMELFHTFRRRQVVTKCWRKEEGKWVIRDDPFIDDWGKSEYETLVCCLQNTVATDGFVCGAFIDEELKGFVSVEGTPIGSARQYMDLSSIHVSEDARGQGIGRELFMAAKNFARERKAEKLYISAHSAVESQAFYRKMGCTEAKEYSQEHVEKEPYDCQLECEVAR